MAIGARHRFSLGPAFWPKKVSFKPSNDAFYANSERKIKNFRWSDPEGVCTTLRWSDPAEGLATVPPLTQTDRVTAEVTVSIGFAPDLSILRFSHVPTYIQCSG